MTTRYVPSGRVPPTISVSVRMKKSKDAFIAIGQMQEIHKVTEVEERKDAFGEDTLFVVMEIHNAVFESIQHEVTQG